ncbi:MAG: aminodeoxychorismate/anthranilate synthase component II [Psychrobacillus sp.]
MILVIDNYDSFTFNLVQYIRQVSENVIVLRNDKTSIDEIRKLKPQFILISPGPGNPDQAALGMEIIKYFYDKIPILGICLGHQVIAQAFGGIVKKAIAPMHGKVSVIRHDGRTVFSGIKNSISVARYHSLIVDFNTLPECLEVSALSDNGEIMGIRHKYFNVEGLQFHPESIMTQQGFEIIENFIKSTIEPKSVST